MSKKVIAIIVAIVIVIVFLLALHVTLNTGERRSFVDLTKKNSTNLSRRWYLRKKVS